jgi:cytochrome c oxidase assembly protein subunit 15
MTRSNNNPWLTRFAVFTAFCTLCLIGVGGLVTSHEAGMAVPDWPTSYGYNMFLFPYPQWVGGIFYEHTHRLLASVVGLLTIVLAVWLWMKEERRWLRWLGVIAIITVVMQGVLGGLRVVLSKQEIGILHAALAQVFLLVVSSIGLFLSGFWRKMIQVEGRANPRMVKAFLLTTLLIFCQLLLGASMRHQHAGLAIPDFPLAYGKLWPRTDAAFIGEINARRTELLAENPITAAQIYLHMAHRFGAVLILVAVGGCYFLARRTRFRGLATFWLGLIVAQAGLGAWTVLSNKAADVATAHVMAGALSLLTGTVLYLITARVGAARTVCAAAGQREEICFESTGSRGPIRASA